MTTPLNIGSRRELFADDFLIESLRDARLQLNRPEPGDIVFTADAPWEDWTFGAQSVVQEGNRIRLYARSAIPNLKRSDTALMSLLESTDGGRSFQRPELGLVEFNGSKKNNLIAQGKSPIMPAAFIDECPACAPDARYKGFCDGWQKLHAMASADGVYWRVLEPNPVAMKGMFDTVNTCFWDTQIGRYRAYTRNFIADPTVGPDSAGYKTQHRPESSQFGFRSIQVSTSEDFVNWADPLPLQYADGEDVHQMYTNAVVPCPGAEHLYVGFPNRLVEGRTIRAGVEYPSVNDALFMSSRDGVHWNRWREAWVRPGRDPRNWTHRNHYPVWHIIRTSAEEWSILISEHYMQSDKAPCRLRRMSIRPWGFVSVQAGYRPGEILTRPFLFAGRQLHLNYATSAAGCVRVEIQDAEGKPIPGFALDDMPFVFGDELDAAVAWKGGGDIGRLAGTPVRLRIQLRDADLFSLRFGE